MGVHNVGVYCVGMNGRNVPGGIKLTFDAHLKKTTIFSPLYKIIIQIFCRFKEGA
jgi:hypothetical protein